MSAATRLYTAAPRPLQRLARRLFLIFHLRRVRKHGHPPRSGETSKAHERRVREGFFDRFCNGKGLDIGHGGDKLLPSCDGWDLDRGDAHRLTGIGDGSYDFVYSSHVLEHLEDPTMALREWWRVLRPGGFMILYVPERDLYEKRQRLPSRFNPDHKHFFLLDRDEAPDTIGLLPLLKRAMPEGQVVQSKVQGAGHTIRDPRKHSDGEYSIEVVLRKPN